GYMAMLRNLRNIMTANPKNIDKVWEKLSDKDEVLKSKLLPFRFYTAYREAFHLFTSKNIDLLETAMQYTIDNLPKINGKTVIAIDVSGSMRSLISRNSSVNCAEIAKLLAILAGKLCEEVIIYKFDTKITKVDFSIKDRILKSVKQLWADGGGTNIALPIQEMIDNKIEADRLIIFSDNEINYGFKSTCQSLIDEYRKNINPELWVHAIDLLGYGTQQFCGKNTNIIAGWSEQILEFINTAEQGIATQVQKIENY
ncbi:MAG: TROVE domain-containing protein, partial [Clostridia bacterium]|nr:TROVE domain-containing protein [Clostridia bacterium]